MVSVHEKIKIRHSIMIMKQRVKLHHVVRDLIKMKSQKENQNSKLKMKSAFVNLIKNCIFKSKF
jgi:hypothetical protein